MRPWAKRLVVAALLSSLACVGFAALGKPPEAARPGPAEAELERLKKRAGDPKADPDILWQDLLVFRTKYPGTPQAVQAAELLTRLPSPLDKLDPKQIPQEDRFDWQPRELVA